MNKQEVRLNTDSPEYGNTTEEMKMCLFAVFFPSRSNLQKPLAEAL